MNSDILLILEAIYDVLTMEENTEFIAAQLVKFNLFRRMYKNEDFSC